MRGDPQVPYVVGNEGIGEDDQGALHYFRADAGLNGRSGALAERVAVPKDDLVPLPDGADPALSIGFGIAGLAAWLGLHQTAELQAGERVLILGASGAVGQIALQVAKLAGAGRVVAAARSEKGLRRAAELGADATVSLTQDGLTDRFKEAAEGELDLVFDPLWGDPAAAALPALRPFGRLVQLGQSAGATATLASGDIRNRSRRIVGHTAFLVPHAQQAEAFRKMVELSLEGKLTVDHEVLALDRAPEAWERQGSSPGGKLVVVP
jgi:NADPH:quinone reductase-like Zn-dependent oxidoreductase